VEHFEYLSEQDGKSKPEKKNGRGQVPVGAIGLRNEQGSSTGKNRRGGGSGGGQAGKKKGDQKRHAVLTGRGSTGRNDENFYHDKGSRD